MKELLEGRGWIVNKNCHCGGVHKIHYVHISHPGITIKTLPTKDTWRSVKNGRAISKGTKENIETYINALDQVTV